MFVLCTNMGKNPSQLTIAELQKAGNEAAKQAIEKLQTRGIEPVGHEVPVVGSKSHDRRTSVAPATRKAS
jgi:hypothetical protein